MMIKRINNDFDILARIKHNGVSLDMSEYDITSVTLENRCLRTDIPDYEMVEGNIKIHITPKLAPRLGVYTIVVSFRRADASLEDGYWNFESDRLVFKIVGTNDEESGGDTLAEQYYAGVSDISTYLGIPIDIASGVNQKSSFPSGTTITVVNDNVNFYVTGTYTATTRVAFTDGSFREDTFNVVVNPSEPDEPTMYYGNTPTAPQIFQSMSINEIFALPGLTPKSIPLGETNFIIHQENSLHYLLIPENDMYLKRAEYGTVLITTLWSSDNQSGAYFTTNPGGTYQGIPYRVFFSYSPMGAFPDDIRIKIIN